MQNHCNFKAAPPALNLHHHLQKMPQPIHYLFIDNWPDQNATLSLSFGVLTPVHNTNPYFN